MIVQPDFLDHWKTKLLVNRLGERAAPLAVIRLWGHCQTRKRYVFENMSADILKVICSWEGDSRQLQDALTECRFIEMDGNTMTVHEWEVINAKLVANWRNGGRGGRPPKNPEETHVKATPNPDQTDKRRPDQTREEIHIRPRWQIHKDIEASKTRINELQQEREVRKERYGVRRVLDTLTPEAERKLSREQQRLAKLQEEFDNAEEPEAGAHS